MNTDNLHIFPKDVPKGTSFGLELLNSGIIYFTILIQQNNISIMQMNSLQINRKKSTIKL